MYASGGHEDCGSEQSTEASGCFSMRRRSSGEDMAGSLGMGCMKDATEEIDSSSVGRLVDVSSDSLSEVLPVGQIGDGCRGESML